MDLSSVLREPLFLIVVSTVFGGVITILVTALRAKSATFRYSYKPERIGIAADDPVFGAVRVQWRDNDVRNLYLITYVVENASARDFENVALKAYTGSDTLILVERNGILDTPDIVPWSPPFREQMAVQPGEEPTADQWKTFTHRREYIVPVFNRGQRLSLQYVCTRLLGDEVPRVDLNVSCKGVRLVRQQSVNFVLGVPGDRAAAPGLTVAVLISATAAAFFQSTWLAAMISLLAGSTMLLMGALLYKAGQKLWRAFVG